MKNWLIDSRAGCNDKVKWVMDSPIAIMKRSTLYPEKHPLYPIVSTWERKSCKLQVSEGYKQLFERFRSFYIKEMSILKDDSLNKELSIIDTLVKEKSIEIKSKSVVKDDWEFRQ